MFAAVMRKAGVPKQLECHGFVCDSPEEAILVAANLYQALLETMKRNKRPNSSSQVRTLVVSEKKRQVSELHLGVTAGNHSSSSSANPVPCLGPRLSGLGSKLPPCCWVAVRTSGQRGRVQLSVGRA